MNRGKFTRIFATAIAIAGLPSSQGNAAICGSTPSLLAHWEGDGLGDSTGNGYTLSAGGTGAIAGVPGGVIGDAFEFDGSDDYLISASINLPSAGSVLLWAKPTTDFGTNTGTMSMAGTYATDLSRILTVSATGPSFSGTGSADQLKSNVGDTSQLNLFSSPSIDGVLLRADEWTQVAVVFDWGSGAFSLWADGLQIDTYSNTTLNGPTIPSQFSLGARRSASGLAVPTRYWPGLIDEARVYDCELTESQIEDIYSTEFPDADDDGVVDKDDNCLNEPNPNQVDTDEDGYGDMCDGDFDDSGMVTTVNYGMYLTKCYGSDPVPRSGGPAHDPTCEESDMNSDGKVDGVDTALFFKVFLGPPGPSGLYCAGSAPCAP